MPSINNNDLLTFSFKFAILPDDVLVADKF